MFCTKFDANSHRFRMLNIFLIVFIQLFVHDLVTAQVSTDCNVTVDYGNHKWLNGGEYFARGECAFTFAEVTDEGDFLVNVTFDVAITSFNDFDTMIPDSQDDGGLWFFSESRWIFHPQQVFGYAFIVSWAEADGEDFPPSRCFSNLPCV